MIKILTVEQIRELDQYTIVHEPIASVDLMERASKSFADWFIQHFDTTKKITVVCGTGNNGGDGLAIARILQLYHYPVRIIVLKGGSESDDFKINYQRVASKIEIEEVTTSVSVNDFASSDIIIDAIFGSGLSRPVEGIYAEAIKIINQLPAYRIAVDIPSGLLADQHSSGEIIQADTTIAFQVPKLAFLMPENAGYVGEWYLTEIGLSEEYIEKASTNLFYVTKESVQALLKPHSRFDHKGTNGHALLIAGAYGKMGAAVLATHAALRSGVGLLTVHIPQKGYSIIQVAAPEAMTSIDSSEDIFTSLPEDLNYQSIGVGPGIGQDSETVKALAKLLRNSLVPVVIDADALNLLSANRELLHLIPANSILTPHPKEFERLVGSWADDFERLAKLRAFAKEITSIVILKGAFTSIALPDGKVYFNSTGNPGMAKGGSGDILTGILTGLLGRRYSSDKAAIIGVFLHGLAGDLAADEIGMDALKSSDIIDYLSDAFIELGTGTNKV